MNYLFDKNWFRKNQRKLLWLLNTPIIKVWFRWVMRIHKYDCKEKITQITPNSITWGDHLIFNTKKKELEVERTTDFRTHNKYSKRLYHAFKYVWYLFHAWDLGFANHFAPQLNLGFDTLTVYPDAGHTSTTVDGHLYKQYGAGAGVDWSTIIADTTATTIDTDDTKLTMEIYADNVSGKWRWLSRIIATFDASSLDDGATISAATLSLYGKHKVNANGTIEMSTNIYSSDPAANNNLATGDYDSLGTTAYCNTPITYTNWQGLSDVGAYNDFAFNATGIAAISKTGISKFGVRNSNFDVAATSPTWGSNKYAYIQVYSADNDGTSKDPKLVITYSTVVQKSVADTGSGSDIMAAIRNTIIVSDSGEGADVLAVLVFLVLSDTGSGADILSALRVAISNSDTGSGSDIMAAIRNSFIAQDSGSGSDLTAIINAFKLSDTGSGNDILAALLIALAIQDVGSGSDEMSGILAQIIASDAGVGSEITAILNSLIVNDTGLGSDALNLLIQISLADVGSEVDAVSILAQLYLSDSGVASEIANILAQISTSDSGSAIEALAILSALSVSDAGVGVDISSLIYGIIIRDSGAGTELVKILNSFVVSDSAIGSEALRVLTGLIIQDAGVGSEETYIKNFVGLHDSGLAVEAAKIFFKLAIQDNGQSEEIINLIKQIQIYDSGLGADVMNLVKKIYPYANKTSPYSDKNNPFNKKSSPYHNLPRE